MSENDIEIGKRLMHLRNSIKEQVDKIDEDVYADSIISLNLRMADEKFGRMVKDNFIDEFDLEKHGWKKNSDKHNRIKK
ncbi:unnamed protein product [marine sediment metagenome]|uniref:Uncharacterized protein n=1 Tax=marine sediment metagenome TaxID=412755 RepID=X0UI57_9ZZZZ